MAAAAPRLAAALALTSTHYWAISILAGSEAGSALLGVDPFNVTNPQVREFIEQYRYKFLQKTTETNEAAFKKLLITAQEEGWSITQFRDELRATFNTWTKQRAEMIARTEVIRSSNFGALLSYRVNGIQRKQFHDTNDARVCPYCSAMDGKIVTLGEPFADVGDVIEGVDVASGEARRMTVTYEAVQVPPLHPHCRCTVLPVIE